MKLDIRTPNFNIPSCPYPRPAARHLDRYQWQQELQPNTWVTLLEVPSSFSFDEALLLCRHSDSEWVAWIPDHGESVLHVSQFFPMT